MKKLIFLLILLISVTGCTSHLSHYTKIENALPSYYNKDIKNNGSGRYYHRYYAETSNGDIIIEVNRNTITKISVKEYFKRQKYKNISSGVYKGYHYVKAEKNNFIYAVVIIDEFKTPYVVMEGMFSEDKEKEFLVEFEDYIKKFEENYEMISNLLN